MHQPSRQDMQQWLREHIKWEEEMYTTYGELPSEMYEYTPTESEGRFVTPKRRPYINALYLADSIGNNCDFKRVRNETNVHLTRARAYGSVYVPGHKFPEQNFWDVTERELSKKDYNWVILHGPSVDITQLRTRGLVPDANNPFLRMEASKSSFNMIKTADSAVRAYPKLREVTIVERYLRIDSMSELSEYANSELHNILSRGCWSDKIRIVKHQRQRLWRESEQEIYGSTELNHNFDGFHLRGSRGKLCFTNSLIDIIQNGRIFLNI